MGGMHYANHSRRKGMRPALKVAMLVAGLALIAAALFFIWIGLSAGGRHG